MTENYKKLINKLIEYKRKFYIIKSVQGLILYLSVLILYVFIIIISEVFLFLKPDTKSLILIFTVAFSLVIFIWLVFIPLINAFSFTGNIDKKKILSIIRKNKIELDDTLLNIIELAEEKISDSSIELINASIEQKIQKLNILNFNIKINLDFFKRVTKRLVIIVVGISITFLFIKNDFTDGVHRIIYYQTEFIKPSPFKFIVRSDNYKVKKGSGLHIEVKLEGKKLPEMVFLSFAGNRLLMEKAGDIYKYEIENINNSFTFNFIADAYYSKTYRIDVLPVPIINGFKIEIISPEYTNIEKQEYKNIGDINIVSGAKVKWTFNTEETSDLKIVFDDSVNIEAINKDQNFLIERSFLKDVNYSVNIKNGEFKVEKILEYKIHVIRDLYPEIEVVQLKDSSNFFRYFFKGRIRDDYGFSNLKFKIYSETTDSTIILQFYKSIREQEFYFSFDFEGYKEKEKALNYSFLVSDNDEIENYKETSSNSFTIVFPDLKEIAQFKKEGLQKIGSLTDEALKLNKEIRNDIKNLKSNEIDLKYSDWEKQKKISDIVKKRKNLEVILNQISSKNEEINNYTNSLNEEKTEIIEKQKQIEELLKEVMSKELMKLFEEFNQLAKEFNKNKFEEISENLDNQLEDLSKQLDRNLEILKRLKIIQTIERIVEDLDKIGNSEYQCFKNLDLEDIDSVIKQISKDNNTFEIVNDEFDEVLGLNKQLKKPLAVSSFSNERYEISELFKIQLEHGETRRRKQLEKDLKINSQNLKNLSFSIKQQLESIKRKQKTEDSDNLKQILDNLIQLSIKQENIINRLKEIQKGDPIIADVRKNQNAIINEILLVKDSLLALSRRNESIGNVINSEISKIEINVKEAIKKLKEDNLYSTLINQQHSMNGFNSLALYISEILLQLENECSSDMENDVESNKKGKGKKEGLNSLKEMQEKIKSQMEKLIEKMKLTGKQNISKELSNTIRQQEILQSLLRELISDDNFGSNAKEKLKSIDKLIEQSKEELIMNNVSNETINRQNNILNKLLEAELSELERDIEKKREAKLAKQIYISNPKLIFEYKRDDKKNIESLNGRVLKLEGYYNLKTKEYSNKIK